MSDEELISLYEEYSPIVYSGSLICVMSVNDEMGCGMVLIPKIGEELKRRHKENTKLMDWDYTENINVRSIIQDYK